MRIETPNSKKLQPNMPQQAGPPQDEPRRFRLIPSAQAQTPPQQAQDIPEGFNLDSAINAEYARLAKIGSDLDYENVHSFENDSTNAMNFVFEAEQLGLDALAQQQKIRDANIRRGRDILTVNTPIYIAGILAAKQAAKAAGPYLYNLEEFVRRQPRTPHGVLTAADNVVYQNRLGVPFGKYQRFYRPGIPLGPVDATDIARIEAANVAEGAAGAAAKRTGRTLAKTKSRALKQVARAIGKGATKSASMGPLGVALSAMDIADVMRVMYENDPSKMFQELNLERQDLEKIRSGSQRFYDPYGNEIQRDEIGPAR